MSLREVLESIRATGTAQVHEIEAEAGAGVHEILSAARLEAEKARDRARRDALAPAFKERARILHQAHIEAMQISGDVRESLVDSVLEQARGRLSGMRMDQRYPRVLRRLLEEALAELAASAAAEAGAGALPGARLEADPRDRPLIEGLLVDLEMELPVAYTLESWGGLVAKSEDGRLVVINTLESRFERAAPFLRRQLAAMFENDDHALGRAPVRPVEDLAPSAP